MQQMLNRAFTHLHLPLLQVLMDFAHTSVLSIAQPPHEGDHIQTTFSMWQCPPPFFFSLLSFLPPAYTSCQGKFTVLVFLRCAAAPMTPARGVTTLLRLRKTRHASRVVTPLAGVMGGRAALCKKVTPTRVQ